MGIRFQRRLNIGKGLGLNVGKSGVSPSIRTKFGSISHKQFTVRTGIKGLSYINSLGNGSRRKSSSNLFPVIIVLSILFIVTLAVWNVFLLIIWVLKEIIYFILKIFRKKV